MVRRTDYDKTCLCHHLCRCSRKTAHRANCQRSHRAPSGSRTIFMCTIVQHVVFVHVSSGQNDHKRHRHSKETMEIFVPTSTNLLNQHLLSALPGDKIDGMSAGRCQKQRKYWTVRRLAGANKEVSHKETTTVIHRGRMGVNTRSQ